MGRIGGVGTRRGRGDGGWGGDVAVKLGLALTEMGVVVGWGGRRKGEGFPTFSGGGSGLERRRPPVQG